MSNASQQIVNKAWNFAHVLRDDGLSYMAYTEQITFLLFLKMADEQTKPPYNRDSIVPAKLERAQKGQAFTLYKLKAPPLLRARLISLTCVSGTGRAVGAV